MNTIRNLAANVAFSLNVLLVFIWYFEAKLHLPVFLEVVGRAHPMLLHLPIGLLFVLGLLWLFRGQFDRNSFGELFRLLLSVNAFFAAATALMGFFLSREVGFDADLIGRHKLGGIGMSLFCYFLMSCYDAIAMRELREAGREAAVRSTEPKVSAKRSDPEQSEGTRPNIFDKLFGLLLAIGFGGVVFVGHTGAAITHGIGFLTAPLTANEANDTTQKVAHPRVFADAIMPIFRDKCTSCHNAAKSKGELQLQTVEAALKGGKSGALWDAIAPEKSLILKRFHLDLSAKEHMPPKGKPQLSAWELALIEQWILRGADTNLAISDLSEGDTLFKLSAEMISSRVVVVGHNYPFEAASKAVIAGLNMPFRKVEPLAEGSAALKASFFVRGKYTSSALEELLKIKAQLVYLNLSNMPVSDDEAKRLVQFEQLETLFLNNSDMGNAGIFALGGLSKLSHLSLVGTRVDGSCVAALAAIPSLRQVFLWNTGFSEADIARLSALAPKLVVNSGYRADEKEALQLTQPIFVNKNVVFSEGDSVLLKNNMPGVEIRYTTDGSTPDSLKSPIYSAAFAIKTSTNVKAKAFRSGWMSSEIAQMSYFISGYKPDLVQLKSAPSPKYLGRGELSLTDGEKGDPTNFKIKKWLGYDSTSFDAVFYFTKSQPEISKITISYCRNIPSYIVPPRRVELLAGNDLTQLKTIKIIQYPPITKKELNDIYMDALELNFVKSRYKYYRIKVENEKKLPIFHAGKGEKGWFFVDEVFFN